jgi:phage tail protein X
MKLLLPALAVTACTLAGASAHAHVSIDQGGTHLSRYGDLMKEGPCGMTGGTRGENVYTYEPGETITLTAVETIRHPGYFRIAFDADGDDDFIDPASVAPINRECMDDPADKCGEDDFYNNDAVLMDNLDPQNPPLADSFKPATHSWQVTLPDVECDNCTLQLIQVMTDLPGIHAPYDPSGPGADDIYFQCVDLVLEANGGSVPPPGAGGTTGAGTGGAASTADEDGADDDSGGCTVAAAPRPAGPGWLIVSLGLAVTAVLGRRRRR